MSFNPPPQRRKPSKRLLVHSDDDDDNDDEDPVPLTKRARTADTDGSLTTNPDDMDVDVRERSLSATDDSRFLPENYNSPAHDSSPPHKAWLDLSKTHKKQPVASAPTKKRSHVVHSDDEGSDSHIDSPEDDLSDSPPPNPEVYDDDFDCGTPPKHVASRAKFTTAKAGKVKQGQPRGTKTMGIKEKEIFMKDERKLAIPPATTSRASSTAAQSQPSDLFFNDDLVPSAAVDPLPDVTKDPFSQAIPKKRKLPPIKKNKTTISTAGTSTPTTVTQKQPPPPVQEITKPSLPTSEQRKQALTGVRDIDLADSKIYAELFKGAGGNTPRSGLKNAEERRKELDKMRDEAKARRAEEAKYTFNLQSQADKIARFELRLRAENSTVLHPNFLAAKFRDEWELDRRNRRAIPKEEGET